MLKRIFGPLVVLLMVLSFIWLITESSHIVAVTDDNYDAEVVAVRKQMPVLVWFKFSEWDFVETENRKIVERVAEHWQGRVRVVCIDGDSLAADSKIAEHFGVPKIRHMFAIVQEFQDGWVHHHEQYQIGKWPIDEKGLHQLIQNFLDGCKHCGPR